MWALKSTLIQSSTCGLLFETLYDVMLDLSCGGVGVGVGVGVGYWQQQPSEQLPTHVPPPIWHSVTPVHMVPGGHSGVGVGVGVGEGY
jgi:hypothetical protein